MQLRRFRYDSTKTHQRAGRNRRCLHWCLMRSVSDIHELAEKLLGRPVWTHELAYPEIWEELREKVKPQFLEICHEPKP